MRCAAFILLSVAAFCPAVAQDDRCLRVYEWFDTEWLLADAVDVGGYQYEVTVREPPLYTADEIDAMQRQVDGEGLTDHPLQGKILAATRALEKGERLTTHVVYLLTDDRWRISTTYDDGTPVAWQEYVSDTDVMWLLTPSQLMLMMPGDVPEQRAYMADTRRVIDAIRHVHNGGMGAGDYYDVRPVRIAVDGDGWVVHAESPEDPVAYAFDIAGTPDAPRVTSRRVTNTWPSGREHFLGRSYAYADWSLDEQRGVRRASTIEERAPDDRLVKRTTVRTVGPFSESEFEMIAALPDDVRGDVIRGSIENISMTYDYRRRVRKDGEPAMLHLWGDILVKWRTIFWSVGGPICIALIGFGVYRTRRA